MSVYKQGDKREPDDDPKKKNPFEEGLDNIGKGEHARHAHGLSQCPCPLRCSSTPARAHTRTRMLRAAG